MGHAESLHRSFWFGTLNSFLFVPWLYATILFLLAGLQSQPLSSLPTPHTRPLISLVVKEFTYRTQNRPSLYTLSFYPASLSLVVPSRLLVVGYLTLILQNQWLTPPAINGMAPEWAVQVATGTAIIIPNNQWWLLDHSWLTAHLWRPSTHFTYVYR